MPASVLLRRELGGFAGVGEFGTHGGIAVGEFLDGEVVLDDFAGADELLGAGVEQGLDLTQAVDLLLGVLDGAVDGGDGLVVLLAVGVDELHELAGELVAALLEAGDVDALRTGHGELAAQGDDGGGGAAGRLAEQGDDGHEELGTHDVHLLEAVGHVDDALVVKLVVGLQGADEHGVLAAFLAAVLVELGEEVLVAVLGGREVGLVLHLEHDGETFLAVDIVAEDEVALGAGAGVVVLLEVGRPEAALAAGYVEYVIAMLLEGLAEHLGGEAAFHVAVALYLLVLGLQHELVLLAELEFLLLGGEALSLKAGGQLGDGPVAAVQLLEAAVAGVGEVEAVRRLQIVEAALESGYLLVFFGGQLAELAYALGVGRGHVGLALGIAAAEAPPQALNLPGQGADVAIPGGEGALHSLLRLQLAVFLALAVHLGNLVEAAAHLGVEFGGFDLRQQGGVFAVVGLERLFAVRTDNSHSCVSFYTAKIATLMQETQFCLKKYQCITRIFAKPWRDGEKALNLRILKTAMKHILAILAMVLATNARAYEILDGRLDDSAYYPSTVHTFKVSVPENYDPEAGACLYVGLDGILCRAPERIDSLIATGDIPPMIGVYLQPGIVYGPDGEVLRYNRSNEFDAPDGRFARFLETELLPAVRSLRTADGKEIALRPGAGNAMIFGLSSGGIAAFNAAWQRPDLFGRVYSGCGTFVPMRGADGLQSLVRKSEPRRIRVFLQDGYSDSWNPLFGSWYEANRMLASALEFAGYDCAFDWAEGGHSVVRTSAIFPDVMKWLWAGGSDGRPTGNATLAPILDGAGEWTAEAIENQAAGEAVAIYPDSTFTVSPRDGSNYLWQTLRRPDGTLYAAQPFYWLHSTENRALSIGGMAFDADGMLWVATDAGIQICDQNGRVRGIIALPRELATAAADSRTAGLPAGSSLAISDGRITLTTPHATYRRRLNVRPAIPGRRPKPQGQG